MVGCCSGRPMGLCASLHSLCECIGLDVNLWVAIPVYGSVSESRRADSGGHGLVRTWRSQFAMQQQQLRDLAEDGTVCAQRTMPPLHVQTTKQEGGPMIDTQTQS